MGEERGDDGRDFGKRCGRPFAKSLLGWGSSSCCRPPARPSVVVAVHGALAVWWHQTRTLHRRVEMGGSVGGLFARDRSRVQRRALASFLQRSILRSLPSILILLCLSPFDPLQVGVAIGPAARRDEACGCVGFSDSDDGGKLTLRRGRSRSWSRSVCWFSWNVPL